MQSHPEDPFRILMVPVITEFILDIEQDKDSTGQPDGKSRDINQ
jgi:hypothetical protein